MDVRRLIQWIVVLATLCTQAPLLAAESSLEQVDELIRAALHADADRERGARVFQQACLQCHGDQAHGDASRGIPALAGQRQAYLIKRLADIDQRECESTQMTQVLPHPEALVPQDWADLAAYLNSLPAVEAPESGPGGNLALGEAIFQAQCASCHEPDARGDADGFVPSLRNQHYSYLLHETRRIATWHRYNVEADLARYLESLESDEMEAVADYLSRLKGPVRDRTHLYDDGRVGD